MSNCTICNRPDAPKINEALVAGKTVRVVAKAFNLARSTVGLHRTRCLVTTLNEAMQRQGGDQLLGQLDFLVATALNVIERSTAKRKDAMVLKGISTAINVLKLKASLIGIKPDTAPRMSYTISFESGRPRAVLNDVNALPEANVEVLEQVQTEGSINGQE